MVGVMGDRNIKNFPYKLNCLFKCYKTEWHVVSKSLKYLNKKRITFLLLALFIVFVLYIYIKNPISWFLFFVIALIFHIISKEMEKSLIKRYKLYRQEAFLKFFRENWEGIRYHIFKLCIEKEISREEVFFLKSFLNGYLNHKEKLNEYIRNYLSFALLSVASLWSKLDVSKELEGMRFEIFATISIIIILATFFLMIFRSSFKFKTDKIREILMFMSLYETETSVYKGEKENVSEDKNKKHN